MKNKLFMVILALCSALFLTAFAACVNRHEHSYTSAITTAPTCTEKGVLTCTCPCGDSYTEEIDSLGHDYVGKVTEPTCVDGGYTTFTCSRCGDSYVGDQTGPRNHNYIGEITREPTHTEKGEKTYVCSVCEDTYVEEIDELPYTTAQYKVEYWLENVRDNSYFLKDTAILSDTEENVVFAEIREYEHYIPKQESVQGVVKADGSLALKVYYDLERVRLVISADSESAVSVNPKYDGEFKYGFQTDPVTAIFSVSLGHEWLGWTKNGVFYTDGYSIPSQTITEDTEIIAHTIKPEMSAFNFTVSGNSCVITGVNDKTLKVYVIPDYVTEIGTDAFAFCSELKTVTIGAGVTKIGNSAFQYCKSLEEIIIPDGVSVIEDNAFTHCDALKRVILPSGLEFLSPYLFSDCRSLVSIDLPSGLKVIDNSAFYTCSRLSTVVIPDSVTTIGGSAFRECSGLVSITLGENLSSIGSSAFNNCYKLVEVINNSALPISRGSRNYGTVAYYALIVHGGDSVLLNENDFLFIQNGAKYYVLGYTGYEKDVVLPDDINGSAYDIYAYAFNRVDSMQSVTVPEGVKSVGVSAFEFCKNLTEINLPTTVTSVGTEAFMNCKIERATVSTSVIPFVPQNYLKEITVSGGTEIPENAFTGLPLLSSVHISSSVEVIGFKAFAFCENLTSFTVDEDSSYYTAIDGNLYSKDQTAIYRFAAQNGNGEFVIPNSVKTIKEHSFAGARVNVCFEDGAIPETIEDYAFAGYKGTSVVVSDSVTNMTSVAFYNCDSVEYATFPAHLAESMPKANLKIATVSSGTEIAQRAFYGSGNLERIYVSDELTTIGADAFGECPKLNYNEYDNAIYLGNKLNPFVLLIKAKDLSVTSCEINENTHAIGRDAFKSCSNLREIVIPYGVVSIGVSAFQQCSSLLEITLPDSVIAIEQNAFNSCTKIESANLGNGVKTIGKNAFASCSSLLSVYFTSSVERIETRAFYNCKALSSVYFDGSYDTWSKISKADEWRLKSKFTVYCSTEEVIHTYEY